MEEGQKEKGTDVLRCGGKNHQNSNGITKSFLDKIKRAKTKRTLRRELFCELY